MSGASDPGEALLLFAAASHHDHLGAEGRRAAETAAETPAPGGNGGNCRARVPPR